MTSPFEQPKVQGFQPRAPITAPMPVVRTLPVLGRKVQLVSEFFDTDMLVLTAMAGTRTSGFIKLLDEKLSGAIAGAALYAGFHGALGSSVLIKFEKGGTGTRLRYILLVGLGEYKHFTLPVVCGLMRLVLEKARQLAVETVTLPVIPNRLTQHSLNLIGTGSIIHCRVEERYMQHGELGNLKEIRLLCAPQAKRHLDEGLACLVPRCPICSDPCIGAQCRELCGQPDIRQEAAKTSG